MPLNDMLISEDAVLDSRQIADDARLIAAQTDRKPIVVIGFWLDVNGQ